MTKNNFFLISLLGAIPRSKSAELSLTQDKRAIPQLSLPRIVSFSLAGFFLSNVFIAPRLELHNIYVHLSASLHISCVYLCMH